MLVATHSGPFHADDVFALALLESFLPEKIEHIRTRDLAAIEAADVAIDVGGQYAPERFRFDHHQRSYEGQLSSAGMVLLWLTEKQFVSNNLSAKIRRDYVDYIDAVDTGRRKPESGVPCIAGLVGVLGEQAQDLDDFDGYYRQAVDLCRALLAGVLNSEKKTQAGRAAVKAAMAVAERDGSRILRFDQHYKWKRAYFELGGAEHPTDYVVFSEGEGKSWRMLAIPPEPDSFAQKRPLPEAWAGLTDAALSEVVGVPGARFCHKNRFIAVFEEQSDIETAIERWGLEFPAKGTVQ